MTLKPGTKLGTCEIVESIGAGGMGEIHRARDSKLERDVAVKVSYRFVKFKTVLRDTRLPHRAVVARRRKRGWTDACKRWTDVRFRLKIESDLVWSGSMSKIVNTVSEAKASLSELIEKASAGEEIIICRAGKPVAVLRAYRKSDRPREPGALRGKIRIAPDFDELPDDIAEALGAPPT